MNRVNVAASVRRLKELRPENYCHNPKCLWRVKKQKQDKVVPCPKHPKGDKHMTMKYEIVIWDAKYSRWESDVIGDNPPRSATECWRDIDGLNSVGFSLLQEMDGKMPDQCSKDECEICEEKSIGSGIGHPCGWKLRECE